MLWVNSSHRLISAIAGELDAQSGHAIQTKFLTVVGPPPPHMSDCMFPNILDALYHAALLEMGS